jgi:DoxX-like protein
VSPLYLAVTLLLAVTSLFSATLKVRRDAKVVKIIHETVGVPVKYFPLLAACEVAGGLGLLAGIRNPPLGIAAAAGLVMYFAVAVVAHIRVGDFQGTGPAAFMLFLSSAALVMRTVTS